MTTGKQLDEATGLQHNLFRWYDSALGQWLSEDPIGFAAGDENVRRYVNNTVNTSTDPLGLWTTPGNTGGGGGGSCPPPLVRQGVSCVGAYPPPVPGSYPWADDRSTDIIIENVDRIQLGIDAVGVVFPPADVCNAIISTCRGNFGDAGLSLIAVIPIFGDGVKILSKADEVAEVIEQVSKNVPAVAPVKTGNAFPANPNDLLPGVPRTVKPNGNQVIYPSDKVRIRAETHPIKPGETHAPRHHDQHYHVETRLDPTRSWNNPNNVQKVLPPNYQPGQGTGFLPGETFPGM